MKASRTTTSVLLSAALLVTAGAGSAVMAADAGSGTFTLSMSSDPGNLDPQSSPSSALLQASEFAYDSLLAMDPADGTIQPQLATTWSVDGTAVELTLAEGITCSDGTPLTASDVVANLDYVADPANQSPFLGTYYPVGATAVADDAARTVKITLAAPAPFVLNGLSDLPIICAAGLADRASLANTTVGTGPYVLSEAAAGDHYTYTIRDGYTWGPDGATTATAGMPSSVVLRIVENSATATNLLLTGDINAAIVTGADAQRLAQEDLFSVDTGVLFGEMWFNHADGRSTADPAVRMALTQAVDLGELAQVLTAGEGSPATTFATLSPVACPGDSIAAALPAFDVAAAGQALDAAGWVVSADGLRAKDGQPLSVTFLHDTSAGPAGQAAAELATQQWTALGVTVVDKAQAGSATQETLFGTGDWDIAWIALNVGSPDQLVPFLSGPGMAAGGTNFAGVANADYETGVTAAAAMQGTTGCPTWLEAEAHLVSAADVVPFANTVAKTFGKGAEFAISGSLIPTSIRMLPVWILAGRLTHLVGRPPRLPGRTTHPPYDGDMSTLHDVHVWIDEHLPELARQHGVPGIALAVLAGGEVFDAATGLLSLSTGVEATPDSVFQIGSTTKLWTASLVMQLVDEGKLDLDQPIRRYLPEFTIADESAAAAITARQLLSHTAGFEGDIFTDTGKGDDCLQKYVLTLGDTPQLFPPGERFSYNNAGYCVLGRLVEVLRERPFDDCVREHLFEPLGLTHAANGPYEAILFRAAVGHVRPTADADLVPAPVWALARSNAPAGSMLAMRPRDLLTFAQMHMNEGRAADGTSVLSPDAVRLMYTAHVQLPALGLMGDAWGLGPELFQNPAGVLAGHDGNTIGQAAFLRFVPDKGVALALLTNGGDTFSLYMDIAGHVLRELAGVTLPPLPSPPAAPERIDASRFVGTYSTQILDMIVSQDDDGRIWIDQVPKGIMIEMGAQPERNELVSYAPDSLIPRQADRGMYLPHAFVGDDGHGRAKYLHVGRVIPRVSDTASQPAPAEA